MMNRRHKIDGIPPDEIKVGSLLTWPESKFPLKAGTYMVQEVYDDGRVDLESTDLRVRTIHVVDLAWIEKSDMFLTNRFHVVDVPSYEVGQEIDDVTVLRSFSRIRAKKGNNIYIDNFYKVVDDKGKTFSTNEKSLVEKEITSKQRNGGKKGDELEMMELEAEALELELSLLKYGEDSNRNSDGKEKEFDYPIRDGNVTPDDLKRIFGFRYVNIDINLEEKQEQDMLNVTYDTFRLLARVINQPMISIGLGRNLTIGIGIKRFDFNVGGAYYRNTRSLQFKNLDEFKHIAHEWFHAFDNYLWYTYGDNEKDLMMSEEDRWKNNDYNHKTKTDFNNLKEAINQSEYMVMSESVAKVAGKYWSSKPEVFARAFEIYANERMNELGEHNNRLVFLYPNNPYPNLKYESDRKIMSAFRTLFDNMEMADIYDIKSLYGNN